MEPTGRYQGQELNLLINGNHFSPRQHPNKNTDCSLLELISKKMIEVRVSNSCWVGLDAQNSRGSWNEALM